MKLIFLKNSVLFPFGIALFIVSLFSILNSLPPSTEMELEDQSLKFFISDSEKLVKNPSTKFYEFNEVPYAYFDAEKIYFPGNSRVSRTMTLHERHWLWKTKMLAKDRLTKLNGVDFESQHFLHGRYRWLPTGVEVELMFENPVTSALWASVSFYQPLTTIYHHATVYTPQNTVVNIIVATSGNHVKLANFVDHLVSDVLPYDPHIVLTFNIPDNSTLVRKSERIISSRLKSFENLNWFIEPSVQENPYRLMENSDWAEDMPQQLWDLLVFVDEDLFLKKNFLMNCRSSTLKGEQVAHYYSLLFGVCSRKVYSPFAYSSMQRKISVHSKKNKKDNSEMNGDYSYWSSVNKCLCLFRNDLLYVASKNPDINSLDKLINRIKMERAIKLVQSPDPYLFELPPLVNNPPFEERPCHSDVSPHCHHFLSRIRSFHVALMRNVDEERLRSSPRCFQQWIIGVLATLLIISVILNIFQWFGI